MKTKLIFLLVIPIMFLSCKQEQTETAKPGPFVEKIQYDVYVKSPHTGYDWWIDNLPGPQREDLVDWIFETAYSGEMQAYDYFNKKLTVDEVKAIGVDTVLRTLMQTEEPYEMYDDTLIYKPDRDDVVKVRFLERWYLDKEGKTFEKEIIGIAPVMEMFDDEGNFFANQPLFWLYFDESYPAKNKKE